MAEAFGDDLKIGLAIAVVFPLLMMAGLMAAKRKVGMGDGTDGS